VRRLATPLEIGDAGSKAAGWELRERREREDEPEVKAEEQGAARELGAGEELPLFLPTPPSHGIGGRGARGGRRVERISIRW